MSSADRYSNQSGLWMPLGDIASFDMLYPSLSVALRGPDGFGFFFFLSSLLFSPFLQASRMPTLQAQAACLLCYAFLQSVCPSVRQSACHPGTSAGPAHLSVRSSERHVSLHQSHRGALWRASCGHIMIHPRVGLHWVAWQLERFPPNPPGGGTKRAGLMLWSHPWVS